MAAPKSEWPWLALDAMLVSGTGSERVQELVAHQLESFDVFVDTHMEEVVRGFNPIEVAHGLNAVHNKPDVIISMTIANPEVARPHMREKIGSARTMTPDDARNRNFTYSGNMCVDVHTTTSVLKEDGEYSSSTASFRRVLAGKVPIMVGSKYCTTRSWPTEGNKCRFDPGGYFIVQGQEKVVISQERVQENRVFVFPSTKSNNFSYMAEIRSVPDNVFSPPKLTILKISSRCNEGGRYIRANLHHVRHDVPLFVLFRAFGVLADRDIVALVTTDAAGAIARELEGSVLDAAGIYSQDAALEYLLRYFSGHVNNELGGTKGGGDRLAALREVLRREVLPHVGPDLGAKARYLGYMARRLLKQALGMCSPDDRDSYISKRVDAPGILLANIFRQYFGKLVKDVRKMLAKEAQAFGAFVGPQRVNLVNEQNIARLIKSGIIDNGLRYALSTGTWGLNKKNTRSGVAQVVNRINTPIDNSSKLVQPRRLHPTQWGVACPAETPEGASVGVVKNLALTARITTHTSSLDARALIREFGLDGGLDTAVAVKVFVNGDFLGCTSRPAQMHGALKAAKRSGTIGVFVSVAWNRAENVLLVNTEAGRYVRPLFVVEDGELVADGAKMAALAAGEVTWRDMVCSPDGRSCIEYVCVQEANTLLIAMSVDEVVPGCRFTHAEIHPSLILGVLASSIPFSDHNQSPRNSYQCLRSCQHVLMADGTSRPIADVRVGDLVVTIDPRDLRRFPARVVGVQRGPTAKAMVRVSAEGASVEVTADHPFLTPHGWVEAADLPGMTALVVGLGWRPVTEVLPLPQPGPADVVDIEVEGDTHSFVGGGFCVHNSAMGKQAVGIYATNHRDRYDTMAHVLNYPQRPLVGTRVAKYLGSEALPNGANVMVAIMTYTGFNQEDAIMVNQSSVQRGLFHSTFYRTFREPNNKNHATGEEEFFCNPAERGARHTRPANYGKLGSDGFVPENTFVGPGDVLIGKCMPVRSRACIDLKDVSVLMKSGESGCVDSNVHSNNKFVTVNGDGYEFAKVRVRSLRVPEIGDKLSSRHGQKGTIGVVYRQEDMPFTAGGIVPDVIINPHAIPSRMTVGQLMECILGKAACSLGCLGDGTPFTGVSADAICAALRACGHEGHGNEVMYDGRTGRMIRADIFFGPTFYQRLKHMVCDKVHSRAGNGPMVMLTRQPAEGRSRDGGLRIGEMEVECLWSSGVVSFLHERFMRCSDGFQQHICASCHRPAVVNEAQGVYVCRSCKTGWNYSTTHNPFAWKLFTQEVGSLGIDVRMITGH